MTTTLTPIEEVLGQLTPDVAPKMSWRADPVASLKRLEAYTKPYLGSSDLAQVLDISRPAISGRKKRGSVPPYDELIGMTQLWKVETIREWLTLWAKK